MDEVEKIIVHVIEIEEFETKLNEIRQIRNAQICGGLAYFGALKYLLGILSTRVENGDQKETGIEQVPTKDDSKENLLIRDKKEKKN